MHAAKEIRAYGEEHGIIEFRSPEIPLTMVNGHTLSMIASGLCSADCYYRGPYEGGAAFTLIEGSELRRLTNDSVPRFIRIYSEFIGAVDCDHRLALESFAYYKGYRYQEASDKSICTSPRGTELIATFDDFGRCSGLVSTVTPEEAQGISEEEPE